MTNDGWKSGLLVLALLAGLGVICPLLIAPHIPLVDPDEGLHASIAQEMVESGDWTVPHLLNEPFLDKPILYFWAIAASLKVFGMSEAAVRLPGLLFGMLGTLSTATIAWRILGRRTGLIAGVFYASMILPLALVQVPAHDVALIPWVNLALLCFWESDGSQSHQAAWRWAAAAGVVLALAILTKGLAGVALVGIAYGGYLVVSRRLRFIHCFRAALALSVAAIIGLSWYLAVEQANPGYLRYYFFERHVLGFLTKSQPHGAAPWWYYFPILIAGGIPWVGYLPVLVRDAASRWRKRMPAVTDARGNRPLLLLICWFVGCTLFLTVSRSKLVTYIWPVFPAMAILAAVVWVRKMEGALSDGAKRWMGRTVWFTCLMGPLGLPATFAITEIALPTQFSMPAWTLAIAAALTSLVPLWSWVRGQDRWTLGLAAATVCGQLVVLQCCAPCPRLPRGFPAVIWPIILIASMNCPPGCYWPRSASARSFSTSIATCAASCNSARWRTRTSTTLCPRPRWAPRNGLPSPSAICIRRWVTTTFRHCPTSGLAASGSIGATTWSRGLWSARPIVRC